MKKSEEYYASLKRDFTKEEIDDLVLTDSKKKRRIILLFVVLGIFLSIAVLAGGIVWIVTSEEMSIGGILLTVFGGMALLSSSIVSIPLFSSLKKYDGILSDKIVRQAVRDCLGKEAVYFPNGEVNKDLLSELGISKIEVKKAREKIVYIQEGVRCLLVELETAIPTASKVTDIVGGTLVAGPYGALAGAMNAIGETAKGQNDNQYFKGVLYVASGVAKTIPQKIVLRTKNAMGSLSASGLSKKDKTITDNNEFNKLFDLYCEDRTLAFYVLTPQLLETFTKLAKEVSSGITVVFDKNYLAIAFSRRNLRISAIRDVEEDFDYKAMYEQIQEKLSPYKDLGKDINLSYLSKSVFKLEKGIYR